MVLYGRAISAALGWQLLDLEAEQYALPSRASAIAHAAPVRARNRSERWHVYWKDVTLGHYALTNGTVGGKEKGVEITTDE